MNQNINIGYYDSTYPQHKNKFHTQGTFISIPQKYCGESIRKGSFELIDRSSSDLTGDTTYIKIKDDAHGNLYTTNARVSQSASTSVSSSDNYVGNIFYEHGMAVITETGSFSGSVDYTTVGDSEFTSSFQTIKTIYTREYKISLKANEFNMTNNPSLKKRDRSFYNDIDSTDAGPDPHFQVTNSTLPLESISGSKEWRPYFNSIGFYDENKQLVMLAQYSQNIEKRDDVDLIFNIDIDF